MTMSYPIQLSLNLSFFLFLQVAATLCFKWGSTAPGHYWWGVALGNLVTAASIFLLVNLYKLLPPATVMALATGGAFLCCQLALLAVFQQGIPPAGWCGIALIFSGILLFAFAGGGR